MVRKLGRALMRWTVDNPVTLKELRIGLRERRIFVVQVGFLLILGAACLLSLASMLSNNDPQSLPQHGKEYFQVLFWVQLMLLLLVTPGLTCGSISGERERHSLDMVLASRLTIGELAAGKLGFAMYYVLLLLFSSLPMASVVFFLGGVSPAEAAQSYVELAVWGLLASQVGLFFSSRETRSNYATSQSYLLIILGSMFLPLYGALRMVDKGIPVVWGANVGPLALCSLLAAYVSLFLFVKTLHRLRPMAVHIKIMGWSFILAYSLGLVLLLNALGDPLSSQDTLNSDWATLCQFLVGLNLVFAGIFLNDSSLESEQERAKWRRSILSRPLFWLVLLSLAIMGPSLVDAAVGNPTNHFQLHLSMGLGVIYLLALAVFVRGLQSLMPPNVRYAVLYFIILSLLLSLPSLGLLSDSPGFFSGVYLSPMIAIGSIWEPKSFSDIYVGGLDLTMAGMSSMAYIGLALLGMVLPMLRRRKPKPAP